MIMNRFPKAAPKKAPTVTIRFYSKAQLATIRKAARMTGMSLNTFAITRLQQAAEARIAELQQEQVQQQ